MAKITDYILKTNPDPDNDYVVIAYQGQNYKVKLGNAGFSASGGKVKTLSTDFLGGNNVSQISPYTANVTFSQAASEANHPGIAEIYSITIPTGAFYYIGIADNAFITGGGVYEAIIRIPAAGITSLVTFGTITDPLTPVPPYDAIYLYFNGTNFQGFSRSVASGAGVSSTSTYTPSANTWYRLKIVLNSSLTQVDFYILNMSGAVLWSASITSRIPAANAPGGIFISSSSVLVGVVPVLSIDWISYYNNTILAR